MRTTRFPLSPLVQEALAGFGAGLRAVRIRRRIPTTYAAERALISRSTLHKVERGDPGVGLGIYASVLASYGMLERLAHLADARFDLPGLALEESRRPRRIRGGSIPGGVAPKGL